MTAVFEQHGLRFQYPENWQLQQHHAGDHALEIYVASPTGAFWSLLAFEKTTRPDDFMQEIIKTLNEQYDSVECAPVSEIIGMVNCSGYDIHFFCLDLLVTTQLRSLEGEDHNLMLMYQAENREFDKMELVFNAITISMLGQQEKPPRLVPERNQEDDQTSL